MDLLHPVGKASQDVLRRIEATLIFQVGYECRPVGIGRLEAWTIPPLSFTLSTGGHGKAQFALQTQYLLDHLADSEGVICVGGAGGLHPQLRVGDVVVGTNTIEHDYCIRFIKSSPPTYPADEPLLAGLRFVANASHFDGAVWFDCIASGDEDIVDTDRAKELREQTGAACVAWEGSGAARAAAFSGVPFIEIRGITDTANETSHGDYHANLKLVMPRLARLLVSWREMYNASSAPIHTHEVEFQATFTPLEAPAARNSRYSRTTGA